MTLQNPPRDTDQCDVIGIDIGGANLKYVALKRPISDVPGDGKTVAASEIVCVLETPFEMWKRHASLAEQLTADLGKLPRTESLRITITGELADCFDDRRHGVNAIVTATETAATQFGLTAITFYGTDGQFHPPESARQHTDLIAASNWHALASIIALSVCENGLLVDVGSTTTDIVAIADGKLLTEARSDYQRLRDGSLVYIGCARTPVCALVKTLIHQDAPIPVMNELFATIDDARLIAGQTQECAFDHATANGRPRTRLHAHARLSRMIGLDSNELSSKDAKELAQQVLQAASERLNDSVAKWWQECLRSCPTRPTLILSGHGQDLVRVHDVGRPIDLRRVLGSEASRAAPSWAVARLSLRENATAASK